MSAEATPLPRERQESLARVLFVASLIVAALVIASIVVRPMGYLVGVVPDDTFYYLKIAKVFGATGYSSFDGINPTNGYHPTWMILLAGLSKLVPDREGFVRATLLFATAIHIGTCFLLVRLFRHWMSRTAAYLAAAVYAVYPLALHMSLMALESNVYGFFMVVTLLVYMRRVNPAMATRTLREVPVRDWAILGACFGLTFLGRTEAIVYLGCFFLLLWGRLAKEGGARAILVPTLSVGLAFLVVVSPWLLFCKALVGHMGQDSGGMKMLWAYQGGLAGRIGDALTHHVPDLLRFLLVNLFLTPLQAITGVDMGAGAGGVRKFGGLLVTLAFLAVVARLVFAAKKARREGTDDGRLALFAWLACGVLASGAVYGLFFADTQPWYAGVPGMLLAIIALAFVGARFERHPVALPAALGFMALCALRFALWQPQFTRQPYVYASQPVFERFAKPDERIGIFNAGIPGYFSDRTIVNLDGLVNSAVVPYWKEKRFDRYLKDAKIRYIFDDSTIEKGERFSSGPIRRSVLDQTPLHTDPPETRWAWRLDP